MDDDYEFEWDIEQATLPGRRFRRIDLAVVGVDLLHNLAQAVTSTLELAQNLLMSHANHGTDRDIFHEQAAREIETLINGDDNG